jgi:hypothetical protein
LEVWLWGGGVCLVDAVIGGMVHRAFFTGEIRHVRKRGRADVAGGCAPLMGRIDVHSTEIGFVAGVQR